MKGQTDGWSEATAAYRLGYSRSTLFCDSSNIVHLSLERRTFSSSLRSSSSSSFHSPCPTDTHCSFSLVHYRDKTKKNKDTSQESDEALDGDQPIPPMSITSDEVNFLVYRYLQESGFVHSSFTFAYESLLTKSSCVNTPLPPGALITFLQKGLQYLAIEEHLTADGKERLCDSDFGLLSPHTCEALMGGGQGGLPNMVGVDQQSSMMQDSMMDVEAETEVLPVAPPPMVNQPPPVDDSATEIPVGSFLTLSRHTSEVFMCSWNPVLTNLIATGSGDATARIWTMSGDTAAHGFSSSVTLKHGEYLGDKNKDVTTLEWSPNGKFLATGSYDGVARVWDHEGNIVYTLNQHKGPIFSLKWSKGGAYLLSGSYDKTTIVWDMAGGTLKQQFNYHTAPALDVDWNGDDVFASCSTDKSVVICKVGVPSEGEGSIERFEGHTDEVNAVKWSPDGALLASCSDDGTAKVWSLDKKKTGDGASPLHDFTDHTKEIYTLKWSPTGPGSPNPQKPLLLATASFDNDVRLWSPVTGSCVHVLSRHTQPVYSIAFSPSATYIASGSLAGKLYIWDVKEGKQIKAYTGKGDIFEVAWNKEESRVAACYSSNTISVVDFRKK